MPEQLSLFGDENTLYNKGLQQLLDLRFTEAIETLERYARLYTWAKEVGRETMIAEFWVKRLGTSTVEPLAESDIGQVYRAWLAFEEDFGYPWPRHRVEHRLQVSLFSRLAVRLDADGMKERPQPGGDVPKGLIFLRADMADTAMTLLQELIRDEPENAKAYGYLGDSHVLRGDLSTARVCYHMAFALDPQQVDIGHVLDSELRQRLADFESDKRIDGRALNWFPVLALLKGFFNPLFLKGMDELRTWYERYRRLSETVNGDEANSNAPLLFHHGMIISDNAAMVRFHPEIDLIAVRRKMKQINPELFSLYMTKLRERE